MALQAPIYNEKGKKEGDIDLPERVFGLPWKENLVHQVVTDMRANAREGNAHTKTRGDVRGGGKKPWRQKGTGQARHGSTRSPIWIGGGVAHGPRNEKDYSRKINKETKKKALYTILSKKLKDGELIFLKDIRLNAPKTKEAHKILETLAGVKGFEKINFKKGKRAMFFNATKDDALVKSFRNIASAGVEELRNINPLLAMSYQYLVFLDPKENLSILTGKI